MNRKAIAIRAAALTSSILLLGGYVAYRAGAFDQRRAPSQPGFMGGSKTKMILMREDVETLQTPPKGSPHGPPELRILASAT